MTLSTDVPMRALFSITLAGVLFWCASTTAQAITEDEYWQRFAVLFHEFLDMKQDGVLMDHDLIKSLTAAGVPIPNKVRGSHAPGGRYARPPGKTWLKRMQEFRDLKPEGGFAARCTSIPKLYIDKAEVCGFEIFRLYGASGKSSTLDDIVGQFHLALICRASPEACDPSVKKKTAVAAKVSHRIPAQAQCFQGRFGDKETCPEPWEMTESTRYRTAWLCQDTGRTCFVERGRGGTEGCGCAGSKR